MPGGEGALKGQDKMAESTTSQSESGRMTQLFKNAVDALSPDSKLSDVSEPSGVSSELADQPIDNHDESTPEVPQEKNISDQGENDRHLTLDRNLSQVESLESDHRERDLSSDMSHRLCICNSRYKSGISSLHKTCDLRKAVMMPGSVMIECKKDDDDNVSSFKYAQPLLDHKREKEASEINNVSSCREAQPVDVNNVASAREAQVIVPGCKSGRGTQSNDYYSQCTFNITSVSEARQTRDYDHCSLNITGLPLAGQTRGFGATYNHCTFNVTTIFTSSQTRDFGTNMQGNGPPHSSDK